MHDARQTANIQERVIRMFDIKKNFGFGCMRLPMKGDEVDTEEFSKMVDTFLENGFNYFDTAHGYIGGKSETAIKTSLTSRYPRERYLLANKLSGNYFKSYEEIFPLFEKQLEACGVEYFDFYLMHALDRTIYEHFKECRGYEAGLQLLKAGKIRHFGMSFHDKADVLDRILTECPGVEFVQLQFNYVDFEDAAVQSRACYEVCRRHGKPVIVMEPVKGGRLVDLPESAQRIFDELHGGSNASYAIRFAAGFEGVMVVLSGMGSMAMMNDNVSFMKDFQPLSEREMAAVRTVCGIIREQDVVPCTACRYCVDQCPQGIVIPDLFACLNAKKTFHDEIAPYFYENVHTVGSGKASDCIRCGACEQICPQHLPIRDLLVTVAEEFEA